MAKLNLDWLDVFVYIYKPQSVSRAAALLGMEQASASIAQVLPLNDTAALAEFFAGFMLDAMN